MPWMRLEQVPQFPELRFEVGIGCRAIATCRLLQAGAAFAAVGVTPTPAAALTSGGRAEIVFRNGAVYTVNGGREWARAVAVGTSRSSTWATMPACGPSSGREPVSWILPERCCCRGL